MRIVGYGVTACIVAASTGACGTAYDAASAGPADAAAPEPVPDASDASASIDVDASDAGLPPTPPRKPAACPLMICPDEQENCKDDSCDGFDLDVAGAVTNEGGICVATSNDATTATMFAVLSGGGARSHVALSFRVDVIDTMDRVIASIASPANLASPAWVLSSRGNELRLCERTASGTSCSPPFTVTTPARIHLYGIRSSDTPTNASIAVSIDEACTPIRVIEATAPFAPGDVQATVGCLDGTGPCTLRFDDVTAARTPE